MVDNVTCSTSDRILETLQRRFGHSGFRPGQEELVRAALAGRDALGLLPTGGGKSLTYLLPAHLLPRVVVVVSPLIALMRDQLDRARACGLRAAALAGPVGRSERSRILEACRSGRLDLILTAPERLASGSETTAALRAAAPALLVVDEAHCLASWGYDFRPSYRVLEGLGAAWGVPVLALTATATPPVARLLVEALGLRDPVRVTLSFRRPNLAFRTERVRDEAERWRRLWTEVRSSPGPALVYASSRRGTEGLAAAFRARGRSAEAFHAGLSAPRRAAIQERYIGGSLDLVAATCAFGMGVDKPDIRRVLHVAPPDSLEAYYQEAGRGGRDGQPAEARLLWHPTDFATLRRRVDGSFPRVPRLLRAAWAERRGRRAADSRPTAGRGVAPSGSHEEEPNVHDGNAAREFGYALDRLAGSDDMQEGLRAAWAARREARRRLRAVARFVRAAHPEEVLLRYLGEPEREPRPTRATRPARL